MIDSNEARGAELALIISYPTSASRMIVLLKNPQKRGKLDWNGSKNAPKNSRVRLPNLWGMVLLHIMATKPIKFLELHYTMTQFLIIPDNVRYILPLLK